MTSAARTREGRKRSMGGVMLNVDVPLLLVTMALVFFGLVMVFSASWKWSYDLFGDHTLMFKRQALFMIVGVIAAVIVSRIDYHHYRRLAVLGLGGTILGLVAVLALQQTRYGSNRSISNGSVMPAEAAKLMMIIYLSVWLYSKRNQLQMIAFGILPMGGILGLVGGLIFAQPDVSAVATLFIIGGTMFFLAGGDLKQILILLVVAVFAGWLVIQFQPTAKKRIDEYVAGLNDPTQSSYHVSRSIESFIGGGLFGVGLDKGVSKNTGLPVPPTDSIFAVVAEETGLVGTTAVLGMFVLLIWRGMKISREAPDMLGSMLAAGITFWIAMEAIINMAVLIGLLPFAGNALPLMSLGGSSLVVTLVSIGILMSIARRTQAPDKKKERNEDAFDGLRWRNRRRNLPRSRRATSARR